MDTHAGGSTKCSEDSREDADQGLEQEFPEGQRVVRRLSVPSNLYVGHFVYVLVYAMGWDGYHLTELT